MTGCNEGRRAVSQDPRPPPGEGDDRLEESLKRGEKREPSTNKSRGGANRKWNERANQACLESGMKINKVNIQQCYLQAR